MTETIECAAGSFPNIVMAMAWNGSRLVEIRIAAGYVTPKSLADAMEVSPSTITRWELGQRKPGVDELFAIAEFLNVSCEEFRKDPGSPIRFKRASKPKAENE